MTVKQRQLDYTMATQAVELQATGTQMLQQQLKNQWVNSQQAIEIAELKVEIEATKQQQAQVQFRENHITVTDLLDIEADFTQANIDLIQTKHQSIIAQAKYQQSINSDTLRFTTP
jgi:outer membrane protein TolC